MLTSTSAANVPHDVCLFLALSTIQRKLCCQSLSGNRGSPHWAFQQICRRTTLGGTGRKDRAAPHPMHRMQTRILRRLRVHRAQHPHPLQAPRLSAISLEDNDGSGKKISPEGEQTRGPEPPSGNCIFRGTRQCSFPRNVLGGKRRKRLQDDHLAGAACPVLHERAASCRSVGSSPTLRL